MRTNDHAGDECANVLQDGPHLVAQEEGLRAGHANKEEKREKKRVECAPGCRRAFSDMAVWMAAQSSASAPMTLPELASVSKKPTSWCTVKRGVRVTIERAQGCSESSTREGDGHTRWAAVRAGPAARQARGGRPAAPAAGGRRGSERGCAWTAARLRARASAHPGQPQLESGLAR